MKPFRGYDVKGRKSVGHWEALLEEWLLVNERYCRVADSEDSAFFYTERACVGTLAAAAWRCGRVALEEFQFEKSRAKRPNWFGRADLFIGTEDWDEYVEAKYTWVALTEKSIPASCSRVMASAVADARASRKGDRESRYIGVAFVPMYIKAERAAKLDETITQAVKQIKNHRDYHAMAWCFPPEVRTVKSDNDNYCPGVVLLAKNIAFK